MNPTYCNKGKTLNIFGSLVLRVGHLPTVSILLILRLNRWVIRMRKSEWQLCDCK